MEVALSEDPAVVSNRLPILLLGDLLNCEMWKSGLLHDPFTGEIFRFEVVGILFFLGFNWENE